MKDVVNFSAGPAILPKEVFKQASSAVVDFNDSGLSILEMSHRSKDIIAVADEATQLAAELLNVPEGYKVLFLQGGASLQFSMVPYNLLPEGKKAGYMDTGAWSKKAIKEAQLFGNVNVLASSSDKNYNYIPAIPQIPSDLEYLHVTSNNTIYGTQYKDFPETSVPLIADMSSDIFSRTFDVSKFNLIYAGAQKNMGCAGTTLVVVKEDCLGKSGRSIPSMLDYQIHIKGESMFNTPPVFGIYIALETMRWLKELGGVSTIQKINERKAAKLYQEIDRNPLFVGTAEKENRSNMNVTFVMEDSSLEAEFLKLASDNGLSGLKGHRSVGGFRASIYNAMPESGIDRLITCMQDFEKSK